jgi:hypothetical protein
MYLTQSNPWMFIFACLAGAIFLCSAAWSILAVIRMLQITIATNVTLSRELSAIQQAIGKIPGGGLQRPPGAVTPQDFAAANAPGEFIPYSEEELYRQEEILRQQREAKKANGFSEESLDKVIQGAVGTTVD